MTESDITGDNHPLQYIRDNRVWYHWRQSSPAIHQRWQSLISLETIIPCNTSEMTGSLISLETIIPCNTSEMTESDITGDNHPLQYIRDDSLISLETIIPCNTSEMRVWYHWRQSSPAIHQRWESDITGDNHPLQYIRDNRVWYHWRQSSPAIHQRWQSLISLETIIPCNTSEITESDITGDNHPLQYIRDESLISLETIIPCNTSEMTESDITGDNHPLQYIRDESLISLETIIPCNTSEITESDITGDHHPLQYIRDCKNPLHLDVVDRYLRRMGDKTIPDEAPPSLESFYPPWVAGIALPRSRCCGFFVSFTNKGIF